MEPSSLSFLHVVRWIETILPVARTPFLSSAKAVDAVFRMHNSYHHVIAPELTGLVPCFLGELVDEVVDVVWDVGGDVVLFSVDSEGAIPDGFEECDDAFDRQAGTFLDGR